MSKEFKNVVEFNACTASQMQADELFLPSIVEVVKHLARMAAERDYQAFLDSLESSRNQHDGLEDSHA
ncbi:hypothetical protein [Sphingomonas colocasiae]|uniref:Uncharacterized protein n=1 Tax=Sphingomonas colocasiae TaxID=1848973 RepID=A0ABS7PSH0_9SPHN|nr:hypothetical protein [Sphingomonas colocasiae]MBY8824291.1 hypothetical protein [Sphingomonas colocasiae]